MIRGSKDNNLALIATRCSDIPPGRSRSRALSFAAKLLFNEANDILDRAEVFTHHFVIIY